MKTLLVLLVLVNSLAVAAEERLSFKNLPLGASVEDIKAQYPQAECFGTMCLVDYMIEVGKLRVSDDAARVALRKTMSIAGVTILYMSFHIYDDKLGRILIKTPASRFENIVTAFADRYGKPELDKTETIRTRAGVPYENRTMTWRGPGGAILISRFGSNINNSSVTYISDEAVQRRVEDSIKAREKASKDL